MFEEAEASDRRRREGKTLGPLDGIPYTAKDSYRRLGIAGRMIVQQPDVRSTVLISQDF
jgi:hypothetical protein